MQNHAVNNLPGVDVRREETRSRLAILAIVSFLSTIVMIIFFGWIVLGRDAKEVVSILTTTAGILAGVVGAVVGFYFREKQ